ncbi:elastin-like isoform X2 [Polistes fuscatus]|uniref:elastin-like isoform X2 n=1 Tax=Polistes fuscatus TaxID=30207 RepID=UPI001CA947A7|nr:elastin-like isoform X2 [Polistes fuscatus]
MRLIFFILICLINTVLSYYSEKTRFDRSINDKLGEPLNDKQWTFTDDQTLFIAYKDRKENVCYLEKLKEDNVKHHRNDVSTKRREKKYSTVLYVPNETLTKLEAWREAGGRIVDFCQGRSIYLLQKTKPIARNLLDPFLNELPIDENDISSKRIADILLTPLINRAKREIQLENRKRLNEDFHKIRSRRQTSQLRGRFRGQTQSQYLHLGNDGQTEGKAEAEATQQSSRAIVAGNNGMGQAQSMSSSGSGCEDCPGYQPDYAVHVDQIPGKLQVQGLPKDRQYVTRPGVGAPGKMIAGDYSGSVIPGSGPTGGTEQYPGGMVPGTIRQTYPGGIKPGTGTYPTGPVGPGSVIPGQYPSGIIPGGTYPGAFVPGGVPTYPGGVIPGTIGGGRPYPGGAVPGTGVRYPGGVGPGTLPTGDGVAYPGGPVRGTTATGGAGVYPGGAIPGTVPTGGGVSYPSGTATGTTATGGAGVYPGSTVPGTGIMYPGGVSPGSGVGYPGGVAPGTVPTGDGVAYPGGPVRGTTATGGPGVYPGGAVPGTVPTGGDVAYPGSPIRGTTATGGPGVYPGGAVPGTVPTGGGVAYPGGVPPGTVPTGGGVAYPGGVAPGTVPTGGGVAYPGGVAPGTVPTRDSVAYPGGPVRGTTATGGPGVYPGGAVPGTVPTGGDVAYPGSPIRGTTATGGPGVYPGGAVPGTAPTGGDAPYPIGIVTGTTATGGTEIYPGGTAPGRLPTGGGGVYPSGPIPGIITTYPGGVPTETLRRPGERYPAETPISGVSYPISTGTGTYPGGIPPGVGTTGVVGGTYPGVSPVGDGGMYPGGITGTIVTGGPTYPGRVTTTDGRGIPGAGIFPNIVTGAKTDVGTSISYPGISSGIPGVSGTGIATPQGGQTQPGITGFITPGTVYPGAPLPGGGIPGMTTTGGVYPGSGVYMPGGGQLIGQYPPSGRLPTDQIPGIPQYPTAQYPSGQYPDTKQYYPGGISGQTIPGQYPGGVGTTGAVEASQYYQKPKDISGTSAEDDSADTQASSSVKQVDSGTETSASAQGKYGKGIAQSQVSGIYSGSASFSAQAGTSDINRSAQAEISGGKDGAVSNAEGVGGRGKSQAQVQLNSDSGATSTGAQSSGWNHGTNSQVQASSKGGMADAQANGEGSTSSQAQIGFQPYLKDDRKIEKYSLPFRGGGTASAQSGTHRGQSQSQLQGSFQYGITYTGAAQAGPYKPNNIPSISRNDDTEVTTVPSDADFNRIQGQRQGLQTSSSSRQMVISGVSKEKVENSMNRKEQPEENKRVPEPVYGEEEYEDQYEDEDYDSSARQNPPPNLENFPSNIKQEDQHQSQMIQIGNANRYDVRVTQDSNTPLKDDRLQPGQSLPGYTVPPGFRGRVMSVAGDDTIAKGDGKAQSQTVALIPAQPNITTLENKSLGPETRSLHSNYARFTGTPISKSNNDRTHTRSSSNGFLTRDLDKSIRPSYYTVTNSVAGKIDDNKNSQKKYEHRYYTKSSTCGYFTFSCNIVYGSNGRTKICKPKVPTYPDGTPMKC